MVIAMKCNRPSNFFVYSYNMGIHEYFDNKQEAMEYIEKIISEIENDVVNIAIDDNCLGFNPSNTDLILCEIVAEIGSIPYRISNENNTCYPCLIICGEDSVL